MVHITATSDLHGNLPDISPCDLLLLCGDLCPDGSPEFQAEWLNGPFREWLDTIPCKEIVGIAGNHDLIFGQAKSLVPKQLRWHYLEDSLIECFGLKIYGTPWQLPFWGVFNKNDNELVEQYAAIPSTIDVLISHAPPFGIFDEIPLSPSTDPEFLHDNDLSFDHAGSISLRRRVLELKPKLFVCGHIHCSVGICTIEDTIFANVSLVNDDLDITNRPASFEINPFSEITK